MHLPYPTLPCLPFPHLTYLPPPRPHDTSISHYTYHTITTPSPYKSEEQTVQNIGIMDFSGYGGIEFAEGEMEGGDLRGKVGMRMENKKVGEGYREGGEWEIDAVYLYRSPYTYVPLPPYPHTTHISPSPSEKDSLQNHKFQQCPFFETCISNGQTGVRIHRKQYTAYIQKCLSQTRVTCVEKI